MRPIEMFSEAFRVTLLDKIDSKIGDMAQLNPNQVAILGGMSIDVAQLVVEKGEAHLCRDTVYAHCLHALERNLQKTRGPGPMTMDEAVTIEAMILDDLGSKIPHVEVLAERGVLSTFNLDAYRLTDGAQS
jgi:hypothetical protein